MKKTMMLVVTAVLPGFGATAASTDYSGYTMPWPDCAEQCGMVAT